MSSRFTLSRDTGICYLPYSFPLEYGGELVGAQLGRHSEFASAYRQSDQSCSLQRPRSFLHHQLDLRTPGISPRSADSRKHRRQSPNFLR